MKKITKRELEQEFTKIKSTHEDNISLKNEELALIIKASESGEFLFAEGEGRGENSACDAVLMALETLVFAHGCKGYIAHFTHHPAYPLMKIFEAMEIIGEISDTDTDIVFGTSIDDAFQTDYVKAKVIISK